MTKNLEKPTEVLHRFEPRISGVALLLLLSVVAAFARLLWAPFIYDDTLIVDQNELLRSFPGLTEIWGWHVEGTHEMDGVFRPLLLTLLWIQHHVGDSSPVIFRSVSFLVHVSVGTLLWHLTTTFLGVSKRWALLAAFIFVVHPLHVTTLDMAWKQGDIWVALMALGSISLMGRSRSIPAFILFLLALMMKESAVVIPLLWIIWETVLLKEGRKQRMSLAVTGIILSAMFLLFWMPRMPAPITSGGVPSSRWLYFETQLHVLPIYAKLLWSPIHLSIDRAISPAFPFSISEIGFVFSWLGIVLILAGLAWKNRKPHFLIGPAMALVWLIPTSSFQPLALAYDETRLYLTIAGLSIGIIALASYWTKHWVVNSRLIGFTTGALLLLLCLLSQLAAAPFSSEQRLWENVLAVDPQSARAHYQVGLLADNDRAYDDAIAHYRRALAIDPELHAARANLGIVLGRLGHLDESATEFSKLLSGPPYAAALGHYHLALDAIYRKHFDEALRHLQICRRLLPMSKLPDKGEAILRQEMSRLAAPLPVR